MRRILQRKDSIQTNEDTGRGSLEIETGMQFEILSKGNANVLERELHGKKHKKLHNKIQKKNGTHYFDKKCLNLDFQKNLSIKNGLLKCVLLTRVERTGLIDFILKQQKEAAASRFINR